MQRPRANERELVSFSADYALSYIILVCRNLTFYSETTRGFTLHCPPSPHHAECTKKRVGNPTPDQVFSLVLLLQEVLARFLYFTHPPHFHKQCVLHIVSSFQRWRSPLAPGHADPWHPKFLFCFCFLICSTGTPCEASFKHR